MGDLVYNQRVKSTNKLSILDFFSFVKKIKKDLREKTIKVNQL